MHFIDSTALGVLVNTMQETQSTESELRLVVDDPYLLKIFRITGLAKVFVIHDSVDPSVAS